MNIRPTRSGDITQLKTVLEETELFPTELLDEMISGFLAGNESGEVWLTCEADGEAIGFCYAIPEQLTEGTWNMLALAVSPAKQGKGIGGAIVRHLESVLRECDQRLLVIDTSGTDEFEATRRFYLNHGYREEARIRDFWAPGADKVTFVKSL